MTNNKSLTDWLSHWLTHWITDLWTNSSCVLTRPKHDKSMCCPEKCSHQTMHCANHDRNMIVLIMIETTSQGSFNHDQMEHVQNGGWMRRRGEWPKDPKLGLLWCHFSRWIMKYGSLKKYNVSYQQWEDSTTCKKTSPQSSVTTVTSVHHHNDQQQQQFICIPFT